ncbi:FUN14 domain-containing protein 1, partial [Pseudolycoriella hygida]
HVYRCHVSCECKYSKRKSINKMSATGSSLEKFLDNINGKSATKQIIFGSVAGWFSGYSTMKIGKTAAFLIGGGIIFLQVANEQGWIKIDYNILSNEIDKAAEKVEAVTSNEGPKLLDRVKQICLDNTTTATGFVGGFLIGMSMS